MSQPIVRKDGNPSRTSTAIPRGNPLTSTDAISHSTTMNRVHVSFPDHNRSKDLINWQTAKEFKWSMAGSSWITEAQNFYVVGRDGSLVFFQIGYSNLGYKNLSILSFLPLDGRVRRVNCPLDTLIQLGMSMYLKPKASLQCV